MKTHCGKLTREEPLEEVRRKDKEIEEQAEAIEAEIGRKIKETEKLIQDADKLAKDRSKLLDSKEEESEEEESSSDGGKWEQGRKKRTLRPLAAQLPILIKGTQGRYVPWASQDLERLVTHLPDIHEGAGK
ncbi:putative pectinesterase/pectinesterase inhibitor 47 [Labeo rohita]|uniref:Pectinesterase/pectinesterase inhibitor 47 n=1 Tax=Labeo rohita TaxID=84645 RepID=A0ABQ8LKE0_LABRO|nr:putative pectinesterase/pectinesterase inhibitor 47 [Labeo rohita]